MNRVHLIISGDVIGVGFRAWAIRQAKELKFTGWVKNREDHTVEIVAEGEYLEEFINRCQDGPEIAWVKNVEVDFEKPTGAFVNFQVVY